MTETSRKWHRKLREDCIEAYGGKCECCGETTFEFLTIDHIFRGEGTTERKKYGGGSNLLRELRKQEFPPGYRVLCYNCNASFGIYGYCPHHPEKTLVDRALEELPFLLISS